MKQEKRELRDIKQQERYVESLLARIADKQGEITQIGFAIKSSKEEKLKIMEEWDASITEMEDRRKQLGLDIQEIDQERIEAQEYLDYLKAGQDEVEG